MASQVVLPRGTYQVGTRELGPATVPEGIGRIQLALDGADMTDAALRVALTLDLSLDGGDTWNAPHPDVDPFPVKMTLSGGAVARDGSPLPSYFIGCNLPQPSNTNRRIRAQVVISGTPLVTQGTLTLD